ncbi:MAG: hypothetical protein ACYCV7_15345 [Acidimicrobiales bacterium]
MLTRTPTLIIYPSVPWDGSVEKAKGLGCQTIVSVRAVARYAEALVANVRGESDAGRVVPEPSAHLDELELFGGLGTPMCSVMRW